MKTELTIDQLTSQIEALTNERYARKRALEDVRVVLEAELRELELKSFDSLSAIKTQWAAELVDAENALKSGRDAIVEKMNSIGLEHTTLVAYYDTALAPIEVELARAKAGAEAQARFRDETDALRNELKAKDAEMRLLEESITLRVQQEIAKQMAAASRS
jgi:hypothetical protein